MTIEQLKRAYDTKPFQPFTIYLADGRRIKVPHRVFIWLPPGMSRVLVVATPPKSNEAVDLLLVTSLKYKGKSPPGRRQGNGRAVE